MRDLSRDNDFLSLNTTTVRGQAGLLDIIDAVARAGIPGISPWRDQTQACGIEIAAKSIKANGLRVAGSPRQGAPDLKPQSTTTAGPSTRRPPSVRSVW